MKEKIPATPEAKYRFKVLVNGELAAQCVTRKAAQRLAALFGEPYFDKVMYAPLKEEEELEGRAVDGGTQHQSGDDCPTADVA